MISGSGGCLGAVLFLGKHSLEQRDLLAFSATGRLDPGKLPLDQGMASLPQTQEHSKELNAFPGIGRLPELLLEAEPRLIGVEKLGDLGEGEAQNLPQVLDLAQTADIVVVEKAIRPFSSRDRVDQTEFLIVADRPGSEANLVGYNADGPQAIKHGRVHC